MTTLESNPQCQIIQGIIATGQEISKDPSQRYLDAAKQAEQWIAENPQ